MSMYYCVSLSINVSMSLWVQFLKIDKFRKPAFLAELCCTRAFLIYLNLKKKEKKKMVQLNVKMTRLPPSQKVAPGPTYSYSPAFNLTQIICIFSSVLNVFLILANISALVITFSPIFFKFFSWFLRTFLVL